MEFMLLVALCQSMNPVEDDCVIVYTRRVKSQSEQICDQAAVLFSRNFVPNLTYPYVIASCLGGQDL